MKLSFQFGLLLAQSLLAFTVAAYPNPIPGSDNIEVRDPAIYYNPDTKKYFVFSTHEGVKIFQSKSITGPWERTGSALPGKCSVIDLPGRCETWAPDIALVNGTYTLYYSVSAIGSADSAIGVAQSPTMEEGSWTDLGEVIRSGPGLNYNCIDPNLIDDGGLKLTFGSYWDGMFQIPMNDVKTPAEQLPGVHLAGNGGRPAEGGFVYKSPDSPHYFMFFSDGITPLLGAQDHPPAGKEYKVLVGRGESPTGPFFGKLGNVLTDKMDPPTGSLVLGSHDNVYAPGGQSLFRDPVSGRDVISYHYVKLSDPIGGPSYLGINYLDFSSGWPEVVDLEPVQPAPEEPAPTPTPEPAPEPTFVPTPQPTPSSCSKKMRSRSRQ
ncbi:glycoside hydrolase family 43 protein [Exidia glandulosa HHB12029]|uniref:Arabinan endo-1,5-alpha-L-arabinosidase n=1 Tax=Exidia glandulosa HHB12029 TaxID=1314781 RepID=A0A165PYF5_EXIGL|nr:glycoside hydrolase family 43 protein [Exidia glandulosa HHB12029]